MLSIVFLFYNNFPLNNASLIPYYLNEENCWDINIEDLKTPNLKKEFLKTAVNEMSLVSDQWLQGLVSDTERFQSIIDSWNIATESLKNRIIDYYQNFDPAIICTLWLSLEQEEICLKFVN